MRFSLIPSLYYALTACATTLALIPDQAGFVGSPNAVLFLNGFHFISGHEDQHVDANHHCTLMSSTFIQCILYARGTNPARMVGIEYIVTGDAFAKLPMEERALWHSHQYEVSSGLLVQPGIPPSVDNEIMKILVNSYGKTVHTWRYDQKTNEYPLGVPELVVGFTKPGQLPTAAIMERDAYFGVNSTEIKMQRSDIKVPRVLPGADAWQNGHVVTYIAQD